MRSAFVLGAVLSFAVLSMNAGHGAPQEKAESAPHCAFGDPAMAPYMYWMLVGDPRHDSSEELAALAEPLVEICAKDGSCSGVVPNSAPWRETMRVLREAYSPRVLDPVRFKASYSEEMPAEATEGVTVRTGVLVYVIRGKAPRLTRIDLRYLP